MKLGWAARVWKWGSFALLSVGLAVLIANRKLIVEALKYWLCVVFNALIQRKIFYISSENLPQIRCRYNKRICYR